ncbi:diketogulonate reductase-like aldo/keto reductase [Streptomyces sp. 3330]|uniref:hypothetical protein n=1 Tax=Streptomyces sp. 3330 TaxID=2817755 RepID=UPI002856EC8A|nr:hypothetical protein [Streptomyces sp. 3330]MDR6979653.1 diketogulonate reductase-like aldo/keto reductase [Streptomyces sp. 3330]
MNDRGVTDAARTHGVTPAQVIPRRHVQLGAVPVPRRRRPQRRRDNLDVFRCTLTEEKMAIVGDRRHRRVGHEPDDHDEF